ncbi:MAG TPA: TerC family protein [Bacillus bacterium]|nr:TerC family protein [Bacillus sp. (in: firmicutes)]
MEMEFLTALLAIVIIDLVLAGDNAIVIGLAARNLPKEKQKTVILWGTIGAVLIRALATIAIVWLLKVPGLLLVGGILLVWIAYKLLVEEKGHEVKAGDSIMAAIRTIIIADAAMGIDNVLAVAGAAQGSVWLVILGLMISVPIVVWGSTIIIKWMERYPVIITIGSGILAWTAAKMIVAEPFMKTFFANDFLKYGFEFLVIAAVIVAGKIKKMNRSKNQLATDHLS